ncbi:MAG: molybdopterin converting factor subunit 1 [Rhodospirillaceae bacterium]|nr:molybdopterin converting factor subunit 1 [Rhodospirillaceae bacterium]MBT5667136.1 molybdopterin converting factor subunit 1 [Rhodospirillaceae bacterium]
MKLLYFAWLRQRVGIGEETVNPPDVTTVRDLVDWLRQRSPEFTEALADIEAFRVAVDQEFGDMDTVLRGDEEIAFFPPMTGG